MPRYDVVLCVSGDRCGQARAGGQYTSSKQQQRKGIGRRWEGGKRDWVVRPRDRSGGASWDSRWISHGWRGVFFFLVIWAMTTTVDGWIGGWKGRWINGWMGERERLSGGLMRRRVGLACLSVGCLVSGLAGWGAGRHWSVIVHTTHCNNAERRREREMQNAKRKEKGVAGSEVVRRGPSRVFGRSGVVGECDSAVRVGIARRVRGSTGRWMGYMS